MTLFNDLKSATTHFFMQYLTLWITETIAQQSIVLLHTE